MKKTYISPTAMVVRIETQSMLAVSGLPGEVEVPTTDSFDVDLSEEEFSGEAASRGWNIDF